MSPRFVRANPSFRLLKDFNSKSTPAPSLQEATAPKCPPGSSGLAPASDFTFFSGACGGPLLSSKFSGACGEPLLSSIFSGACGGPLLSSFFPAPAAGLYFLQICFFSFKNTVGFSEAKVIFFNMFTSNPLRFGTGLAVDWH